LPLPRYFARSRERAGIFLAAFARHCGPAELVYTRQGAGREQLRRLQRHRALPARVQQVKIWE
ncbi:MAG TPA: hypothetical protein V6D23_00225, partial [Candidatus Obscuribacterales bacterium]